MNTSASLCARAHRWSASARRIPSGTPYRENLVGLSLAAAIRAWSRRFILSRKSGVAQSSLSRAEVALVALGAPVVRGDFLRCLGVLLVIGCFRFLWGVGWCLN
jgi:hypothetical protein